MAPKKKSAPSAHPFTLKASLPAASNTVGGVETQEGANATGVWPEQAAPPPSPFQPTREDKMPQESDISNAPTATLWLLTGAATMMGLGPG